MEFRLGVHVGDVLVEDRVLYGDGVNVAARLESLAEPGRIWISRQAYDQVHGKLPLQFKDLGDRALKNIPGPVRVYRVAIFDADSGAASATRRLRDWALRVRRPIWVASLAVVFTVAAALTGWMLDHSSQDLSAVRSIAVLPLENLTGDPDQDYFAAGVTEELIGALSKIGALRVPSRRSVLRYRDSTKPMPEIARELGVDALIEGSVRRQGDRVRITVQLIRGATDAHLWSDRRNRFQIRFFSFSRGSSTHRSLLRRI